MSIWQRAQALLRNRNQLARECLGELLGTFLLVLITLGGSAQMVTTSEQKGNLLTSYLAGALAVMVGIYTAGGVSGAHMNPAFSLAMCLLGQLPCWKLPIFAALQLAAAFLAAAAAYALYYDAIWSYANGTLLASGPRETASIFATYPAPYLSLSSGFLDQVIGTGVLILGILAIVDARNKGVPRGLEPVAVALLVLGIEVSMGANCGCPLNPARDFGPRLFTAVAGWGPEVFRGLTLGTPPAAGAGAGGGYRWWHPWWAPPWAPPCTSSASPSTSRRRSPRLAAARRCPVPSPWAPRCQPGRRAPGRCQPRRPDARGGLCAPRNKQ
ncbi:aquaporin-10-like isoform X1 [Melanerpes formicivorus]|uniref:aquaporin-10-like isoform X1 n=1 Tax=Melanerpes formicivorus TaxID=211600 RepID=UPI00358F6E1B